MANDDGSLKIGVDEEFARKSAEQARKTTERELAKTRAIRPEERDRVRTQRDAELSAQKTAEAEKEGAEARINAAKETLRAHREAGMLRRADAINRRGGPGADGVDAYGRPTRGRRYGADSDMGRPIARFVGTAGNYIASGGSDQGTLTAMHGGMNMALDAMGASPGWKQLTDVVTGIAMDGLSARNTKLESGLRAFQTQGEAGAGMIDNDNFIRVQRDIGFSTEQTGNLIAQLGRTVGDVDAKLVNSMSQLEQATGLGSRASSLMGAGVRAGAGGGDRFDIVGQAIGLAVAQNLERGRMGEAFDQIASALQAQVHAQGDAGLAASRAAWISNMGERFKGVTPASQNMQGVMSQLASGATPFTRLAALRATGQKDYFKASLAVARGVNGQGGFTDQALAQQMAPMLRDDWARDPAAASGIFAQLTGINQADAYDYLDNYFKTGGMAAVAGAATPDLPQDQSWLQPRIDAARAQYAKQKIGAGTHSAIGAVKSGASAYLHALDWNSGNNSPPGLIRDTTQGMSTQLAVHSADQAAQSSMRAVNAGVVSRYGTGGTSSFGAQRQLGGKTITHPGLDLKFPPGTRVHTPFGGKVTQVGYFGTAGGPVQKSDGYLVVVDVSGSPGANVRLLRFMHLDPATVSVTVGNQLEAGTYIGSTLSFKAWQNGVPTHLHVEAVRGTGAHGDVDPSAFVPLGALTNPGLVNPALAADASGGFSASPSLSAGASGGAPSGGSTASPQQTVKVQVGFAVHDRTNAGVSVRQLASDHADDAAAPSADDVPASRPR